MRTPLNLQMIMWRGQTEVKKASLLFLAARKRKFRKAGVIYKGSGAKAVFYRQLLEYEKERFFIFGPMTLYSVIGVIVCICSDRKTGKLSAGNCVAGCRSVFRVLMYRLSWKMGEEVEQPYIYLIPDSAIEKIVVRDADGTHKSVG